MEVIQRGAEAVIYLDGNKIIKERVSKGYRIKEIDEKLRKTRTRQEAKLLEKAGNAPKVLEVSDKTMKIEMEYIKGDLVKDVLDDVSKDKRHEICKEIGKRIGDLHKNDVIHGDLTTSNMILNEKGVVFIDFGLGFISKKEEDKAVDLHLLKHALESKHYEHFEDSFEKILEGYKSYDGAKEVLERLQKVSKRGRYKGQL